MINYETFRREGGYIAIDWDGLSIYKTKIKNGIYMANNIDFGCKIWNCQVIGKENTCVIGRLGDLEHLRKLLPLHAKNKKCSIACF